MAFDRIIVAIRLQAGVYAVVGAERFNSTVDIDWTGLEAFRPFVDVGDESLYVDEAIVLARDQLLRFVKSDKARRFVEETATGAQFFLVHRAEWESGLSDD